MSLNNEKKRSYPKCIFLNKIQFNLKFNFQILSDKVYTNVQMLVFRVIKILFILWIIELSWLAKIIQ